MSAAEWGERLFTSQGCPACHSIALAPGVGPALGLPAAADAPIDPEYLRRAILEPSAELADGFEDVMPSYASLLSDAEVDALVAYVLTLPGHD